jgi:adenylate kinase family enzyme
MFVKGPPPQPQVKPRICVVGRPKSGKTSLAKQIAKSFDLEYLTVENILEFISNTKELTIFGEKVVLRVDKLNSKAHP